MARQQMIADALERVTAQANKKHAQIISSSEISRTDRELLLASGWLQEIIRGWYMLVRPDVATGDTAAWYANFWDFLRVYLQHRFSEDYCLSIESSLDLHVENPIVPKQVIVIVKQGAGLRKLMHDTSLLMYANPKKMPTDIEKKNELNVMSLAYALCKAPPSYFKNYPRDAELALRSIKTTAEITQIIVRDNLKAAAARLIGAYQFLDDKETAESIIQDIAKVGIRVVPNNPFTKQAPLLTTPKVKSPYSGRIQAMWADARDALVAQFPKPPKLPKDVDAYMNHIEEIYQYDAYNSLSIEGYQVTNDLINRVKNNDWNPDRNEGDGNARNAMAAKGYFDAFQEVKSCIARIIKGENAAIIIRKNLQTWYQNLFGPSVQAGLIEPEALFGYRNDRVFIRNSRHSPPRKEAVVDAMEAFFGCMEQETHPGVNAVLGHYFFVFIHPYMDGNGRIARFLMNALFASGGYPWTVVRVDNRNQYISILENTHLEFDLLPFSRFIHDEMIESKKI